MKLTDWSVQARTGIWLEAKRIALK